MFGFVRKKKYEEALEKRRFWEEKYKTEAEKKFEIYCELGEISKKYAALVSENKELKKKVAEYKEKYADEIQKRLELAEFIKQAEESTKITLFRGENGI